MATTFHGYQLRKVLDTMKRILCVLIVVAMLLSCNVTAFAATESNVKTYAETGCKLNYISDNAASPLTGFSETECMDADYSYELRLGENNSTTANVITCVNLNLNGSSISVQAAGEVNPYPISESVVLWEGPLDGTVEIGNELYEVIVGFATLSDSPSAQMTVTLQGTETNDLMIFTVGGNVITDEVYQAIADQTEKFALGGTDLVGAEPVGANNARLTDSYVYKTFDYANFENSDISGYSQRARFYFNEAKNAICVSLTSYCNNVDKYYADKTYAVTTNVASFEIGLTRKSDATASYSWISGIDSADFNVDNFGGGATLLIPLFEDIMGFLGIPTATIGAFLDGLKGSADWNSASAKSKSLSVTFGLTQEANFDGSSYAGIPVVFQMDRNYNGTYTGNSAYTYTTSIRYRSCIVPEDLSSWYFAYVDAEDATGTGTVTLS